MPVPKSWYTPRSREAPVEMNDALRFVRAESQHAAHAAPGLEGLARYAHTRAARARLNLRNVAGVLKPPNPGPGSNGMSVAAWSSVLAESSSESTCR